MPPSASASGWSSLSLLFPTKSHRAPAPFFFCLIQQFEGVNFFLRVVQQGVFSRSTNTLRLFYCFPFRFALKHSFVDPLHPLPHHTGPTPPWRVPMTGIICSAIFFRFDFFLPTYLQAPSFLLLPPTPFPFRGGWPCLLVSVAPATTSFCVFLRQKKSQQVQWGWVGHRVYFQAKKNPLYSSVGADAPRCKKPRKKLWDCQQPSSFPFQGKVGILYTSPEVIATYRGS